MTTGHENEFNLRSQLQDNTANHGILRNHHNHPPKPKRNEIPSIDPSFPSPIDDGPRYKSDPLFLKSRTIPRKTTSGTSVRSRN